MSPKFKKIFFLIAIFFNIQIISAQFSHYLKNFSTTDYKSSNQNWDIKKSEDGRIYVANNSGLLEFDGVHWNLWKMPNETVVRTVFVDKERIYVGSYEEFGYFKRNTKGALKYHSLIEELSIKNIHRNEAYWQIIRYKNAIVFRSFLDIYIYENGKISRFETGSTIMSCDVVKNKLLISTLGGGIFSYENKQLKPYFNSSILSNFKIVNIYQKNNQLYINTALNGIYILKNNHLIALNTEINNLIKKFQLNRFSQLLSGNLIYGTIKNGIYITTKSGKVLFNINKETGLLNNTILGQCLSNTNELWLSLDNGIAFVDLNTPNFFYNDKSGKLGAVYDVINYKNTIYLGSNTGLYFINKKHKVEFIEGSQGQVWYLKEIDGKLFCGHNNGTYIIENKQLKTLSNFTGGWVIKKVPEHANMYMEGTYTGLVRYKKEKGIWVSKHLGKISSPIRFLEFEDEHTAWIGFANKGLFKIKFNRDYDSIVQVTNYNKKGLWSDYFVRIHKIKNTIAFHTIKGWQKYEPLLDSIVPYTLLSNKFSNNSYIISEDKINELFFKIGNAITYTPILEGNESISIPVEYFSKRLISGNENVSKISDSTYALSLYDGFMVINTKNITKKEVLQKPNLVKLELNGEELDLDTKNITLPFRKNDLKIEVSSSMFKTHNFEYKLSNPYINENWIKFKNGLLEFSNLSDGNYKLGIRTVDFNNKKSAILPIQFTVSSPWYKSNIGFLLYTFLIILFTSLLYVINKRKTIKQQNILKKEFQNTQKQMLDEQNKKSEQEIIKIKNETLKNELQLKRKELANTAMALANKNETLLKLKNELIDQQENFSNQYSFKKIIKQIDRSVKHEDEWKIFEHNFNQVHEEYFNKLKANYPNLTQRDLRICAYLKMNLSTKEIVPLLNISIRGIETQRYRLKRKLNLEKNDSLRGFLQKFN